MNTNKTVLDAMLAAVSVVTVVVLCFCVCVCVLDTECIEQFQTQRSHV